MSTTTAFVVSLGPSVEESFAATATSTGSEEGDSTQRQMGRPVALRSDGIDMHDNNNEHKTKEEENRLTIASNVTNGKKRKREPFDSFSSTTSSSSSSSSVPSSFLCPITMEVMKNPVMDLDGNTYERENILEWIRKNYTKINNANNANNANNNKNDDVVASSPITRNLLKKSHLVPNLALKEVICQYMGKSWSRNANEYIIKQQQREIEKEERHKKELADMHRNTVRGFMKEIFGRITRLRSVQLNEHGVASFKYEHLTFVIEVPKSVGCFFLYSTLFDPKIIVTTTTTTTTTTNDDNDNNNNHNNGNDIVSLNHSRSMIESIYIHALKLNYLQQDTRGAAISIDKETEEIVISYTDRIHAINHVDFRNILENFIDTALNLDRKLKDKISKRKKKNNKNKNKKNNMDNSDSEPDYDFSDDDEW